MTAQEENGAGREEKNREKEEPENEKARKEERPEGKELGKGKARKEKNSGREARKMKVGALV